MHGGFAVLNTTVKVVRVGRKRKSGRRKPSGGLAQTYENPKAFVMSQPHRASVRAELRHRVEAESEFGRLMCFGIISPAQHEAGDRYRQISNSYRSVLLSAPSHSPRSVSLLGGGGEGIEPPRETIQAIKKAYDAAFEKLGEAGNRAQRAVKEFAVFEKRTRAEYDLALLKRGLDKLVEHFGIDRHMQIRLPVRNIG